jgi:DNA-binding XRE family transcriptional regulator
MTGAEFRAIRLSKSMTQTDMGNLLQVGRQTIHNYETDKRKIPRTVEILMCLLNLGVF